MEKDKYLLHSVHNALELVDLLSHYHDLSLAELSRLSGFDKSSAFRLLYTLEKSGYVEKTEETRYRLGMKFLYYGNLVAARQDIITVARPILQHLAMRCKLAVHLGTLNEGRVVTIHKEESPYDIQVTARVGMNAPAYTTAMGRAILAYLPGESLTLLLERTSFKRYSPNSITSADELRRMLAEVRRTGWASDVDDRFPGFGSIACPVFDHTGSAVAAVGVVGMARDILDRRDSYLTELKGAAEAISAAMGCRWDP